MSCKSIRSQVHQWMDAPSPGAMPDSVRDHIRECPECHAFIKRWNAIEVGLVSIRNHSPGLSPAFATSLDARLTSARQVSAGWGWFQRLLPPRQARLALAAGSAALVIWLCYLVGSVLLTSLSPHGAASVAGATDSRHVEPATPIPAQIQITPH